MVGMINIKKSFFKVSKLYCLSGILAFISFILTLIIFKNYFCSGLALCLLGWGIFNEFKIRMDIRKNNKNIKIIKAYKSCIILNFFIAFEVGNFLGSLYLVYKIKTLNNIFMVIFSFIWIFFICMARLRINYISTENN
jgi:hypothetical protein